MVGMRKLLREAKARLRRILGQWKRKRVTVAKHARFYAREDAAACAKGLEVAKRRLAKAREWKRRHDTWGSLARNTVSCHRCAASDHLTLYRSKATGKPSWGGFQVCAGATRCPICSNRIGSGRAKDIGDGLTALDAMGGFCFMLTQTGSHGAGTDPIWMTDAILRACEIFWRDGSVKRALEKINYVGSIKSLEITDGKATGPHPHRHNVICLSGRPTVGMLDEFRTTIAPAWVRACAAVGLISDIAHGSHLAHRLDIRESESDRIGYYLSKLGLETALVASKKGADGRYTLSELLACAHRGDVWAARRWTLWQVALRGRSLVKWSRHLRDALGLGDEKTDEELARGDDEAEDREPVNHFSKADGRKVIGWRNYHDFDVRSMFLELVEARDGPGIAQLCEALGIVALSPGSVVPSDPFADVSHLTEREKENKFTKRRAVICDAEDLFSIP